MTKIKALDAWEILDSRGRPTIAARITLEDGTTGKASVPSGASTGRAEAHELRDGEKRYRGLGCRRAIDHICGPIAASLVGSSFENQDRLDHRLLELDDTSQKTKLGGNALLATSLAFARAMTNRRGEELFEFFASLLPHQKPRMPALTINLFSGGKHAFGQAAIQDVLVAPKAGTTIADRLAVMYDIYQAAAELVVKRYQVRPLKADEGGLAPPYKDSAEMIALAIEAVDEAGYKLGKDALLAIDLAASHFVTPRGQYELDGRLLSPEQLIETIGTWTDQYPIVSVEDGLGEEDWDHWPMLRRRIAGRALTLADDFTCTNRERIRRAIATNAADALLLKVNQVGTLTEARDSLLAAKEAGWQVSISARSGETEDNWLADLAVGWAGDFIKVGSIAQSERLAKYNRLLEIEHRFGPLL